ncbi:hypothetical protein mRhiFer1_008019 [Rhinolophus ferrumequinum]|uniref:Uncharacterized protein n=1 Tax=Rhinolophus ferrumequinum TaxID=59479 RepID=A0A7J7WRB0_RHIFE|nr:hypothetical protein mRhiFer1_008019 [Rhinolophus ferrumequinum]
MAKFTPIFHLWLNYTVFGLESKQVRSAGSDGTTVTFRRCCFSLSDVPERQSPSTKWQGHWPRFGGHLCYSLTSSCAPGELTKPSAFCGQLFAARHCGPQSPVNVQYIFQEGGENGFKASPAGIRRWHQEVSPVPEKRTLVAVPRTTGKRITESPCEACR